MLCFDVSVTQITLTLRGEWLCRVVLEVGKAVLCSTGEGGRAAQGMGFDRKEREKGTRLLKHVGDAESLGCAGLGAQTSSQLLCNLASEAHVLGN